MTEATLQIIVREKAELADGWKITAEIPSFQSKFPTNLTRVPTDDAAQLQIGQAYDVVLERQRAKKDNPTRPYDYYWGWVGFAPTEPVTSQTPGATAPRGYDDGTNRRCALIQALEWTTNMWEAKQLSPNQAEAYMDERYWHYLQLLERDKPKDPPSGSG